MVLVLLRLKLVIFKINCLKFWTDSISRLTGNTSVTFFNVARSKFSIILATGEKMSHTLGNSSNVLWDGGLQNGERTTE